MSRLSATALRERMELAKAIQESKFNLEPGECDFVPPLELLGIFITQVTVARMVHRGQLDMAAAGFLNATLTAHTFTIIHHCTHESISQHNPEHMPLENATYRLATVVNYLFDDSFREAHRQHHVRNNQDNDPDAIIAHTPLKTFGHIAIELSKKMRYVTVGGPLTESSVEFIRRTGLTNWLLESNIAKRFLINWNNVTHKVVLEEVFKTLEGNEEYKEVQRTLQGTWHGARSLSLMFQALFFSRLPHRHCITASNEGESYHDTVFRGQTEIDRWMFGEGAHQLHHAKPDVSYSRLQMIAKDFEANRPEMAMKFRGSGSSMHSLEYGGLSDAPHVVPGETEPMLDFHIKRTETVLSGKDSLRTDTGRGLELIATAVLDSSLHICDTTDISFLRRMTEDMGYLETAEAPDHPLPMSCWNNRVFTQANVTRLRKQSDSIRKEVAATAQELGKMLGPIESDDDLKERYLDFYGALVDVMVPAQDQATFMTRLRSGLLKGAALPQSSASESRAEAMPRLRQFLEAELPSNFLPSWRPYGGKESIARERAAKLVCGPQVSKL